MKNPPKVYPEIFVTSDFLNRPGMNQKITQIGPQILNVTYEHGVLGTITEIFTILPSGNLRLHAVFPNEFQSAEQFEIVKDYYNNFLLKGEQTYIDYFHEEIGYFLQSRNITTLDQ